jgi:hypothetical protein
MRWSLCSGIREHGERIHAVESLTSGNFSLGKETCRKFICPYNRLFGYSAPVNCHVDDMPTTRQLALISFVGE